MLNYGMRGIALITAMIFVAGCGKKVEEAVQEKIMEKALNAGGTKDAKVDIKKDGISIQGTNEKGEKVNVNVSGDKTTFTTTDSEKGTTTISAGNNTFKSTSADGTVFMSGEGAKIPDDFPKDVPIYAGSTVFSSSTSPKDTTYAVQLQSNDKIKNVSDYYVKEMTAQGWKENQKTEISGDSPMTMLSYEKDERTVVINIMSDHEKSTIMISVSKK